VHRWTYGNLKLERACTYASPVNWTCWWLRCLAPRKYTASYYYYYYYYYYCCCCYLFTFLSFHSKAVVLTLIQTKQIRIYIKETIQKHSTNNTKHSKYKYTYYQNTHTIVETLTHTLARTLQNKLQQPQYKINTKWNSHNTIKYPQYKIILMYMALLSPRTSPELTSLHFTSLQKSQRVNVVYAGIL